MGSPLGAALLGAVVVGTMQGGEGAVIHGAQQTAVHNCGLYFNGPSLLPVPDWVRSSRAAPAVLRKRSARSEATSERGLWSASCVRNGAWSGGGCLS